MQCLDIHPARGEFSTSTKRELEALGNDACASGKCGAKKRACGVDCESTDSNTNHALETGKDR